jgi:hypothetical protein
MMKLFLETKRLPLQFRVRAHGALDVVARGEAIRGRWDRATDGDYSPGEILLALLNSSNDIASIVDFTKRYGPLTVNYKRARGRFSFRAADWRKAQRNIGSRWKGYALYPEQGVPLTVTKHSSLPVVEGEEFQVYSGDWTYVASTLSRMLQLELLATPPNRLRRCNWQACQRYFIAEHRGEKYCSEACSADATREAKLKWWRSVGEPRRVKRSNRNS